MEVANLKNIKYSLISGMNCYIGVLRGHRQYSKHGASNYYCLEILSN